MEDSNRAVLHLTSLAVSTTVALLLYPVVRKGLSLKDGLVYEMGRCLLLPPVFIAAFCAVYTSAELGLIPEAHGLAVHGFADALLIAASLSLLRLAARQRRYLRRMEE